MIKSANSPEVLFRIVMWILTLAIAWFFTGLGGIILRDLPKVDTVIRADDFLDQATAGQINRRESLAAGRERTSRQQQEQANLAVLRARGAYESEHAKYRNWLAARGITEDDRHNPEFVDRARKLDELQSAVRTAEKELEQRDADLLAATQEQANLSQQRNDLRKEALPRYEAARRHQELTVFGIRLLFTLPLLLLGAWAVRTQRKGRYWPLWRGYAGFALYAFFFELVPYLPSYGGYVRYSVGIILTVVAGHYLVRWMQAYLERRRAAEQLAETTRRASLDRDEALRKMAANLCPSCERPVPAVNGQPASYCVHCGLNLYRECPSCHARMNSFYTHCGSCGTPLPRCTAVEAGPVPPLLGATPPKGG
ncbi:MAG: hypothetical protein ACHQ5A_10690 [Opitutales bacterium]